MLPIEKKRRGRPPKKKESGSDTSTTPAIKRARMASSSQSIRASRVIATVPRTLRSRGCQKEIVVNLLVRSRANSTPSVNPTSLPAKKRRGRPPKNPALCRIIDLKKSSRAHQEIVREYRLLKHGRNTEKVQVSLENEIAMMEMESRKSWKARAMSIATSAADPSNHTVEVEFIVGNVRLSHRPHHRSKIATLAKFKEFPRSIWIRPVLEDRLLREFRIRNQWENELAIFLRSEFSGKDTFFQANFGKRYLDKPGKGEVYTELKTVSHHRTLIRVREQDFNTALANVGMPPLYILDWSGQKLHRTNYKKNSLFEFEYTSYLHPSRRVQKVLEKMHYPMIDECDDGCACSAHSKGGRQSCSCNKDKSWKQSDMECYDQCTCPTTCANRTVQRGRQMPLIMMRHTIKGWTVRAFRDIKKGEYIGEYTGEVLTYAQHLELGNNTYSIDLPCCFADKKKKDNSRLKNDPARRREKWMKGYCHRHFVITAKRKGNEGRTFSHSCDPNMEMRMTYIERYGYGYHHIAFWANQDIPRFGELTWNYFGEALEEAQRKNETYSCSILPECCCGSPKCVIVPLTEEDDDDVEEDSDDSCSDYSDDEEETSRRASSNGENTTPTRV